MFSDYLLPFSHPSDLAQAYALAFGPGGIEEIPLPCRTPAPAAPAAPPRR